MKGRDSTPLYKQANKGCLGGRGEGAPTLQCPTAFRLQGQARAGQEQSSKGKPRAPLLPIALRAVFLLL